MTQIITLYNHQGEVIIQIPDYISHSTLEGTLVIIAGHDSRHYYDLATLSGWDILPCLE